MLPRWIQLYAFVSQLENILIGKINSKKKSLINNFIKRNCRINYIRLD